MPDPTTILRLDTKKLNLKKAQIAMIRAASDYRSLKQIGPRDITPNLQNAMRTAIRIAEQNLDRAYQKYNERYFDLYGEYPPLGE